MSERSIYIITIANISIRKTAFYHQYIDIAALNERMVVVEAGKKYKIKRAFSFELFSSLSTCVYICTYVYVYRFVRMMMMMWMGSIHVIRIVSNFSIQNYTLLFGIH
jgi:hypothetical protein